MDGGRDFEVRSKSEEVRSYLKNFINLNLPL
jgi:hypothetical protein